MFNAQQIHAYSVCFCAQNIIAYSMCLAHSEFGFQAKFKDTYSVMC